MDPNCAPDRLFSYGTLQPGGPNEHVLAPLGGTWEPGWVTGHLAEAGWGADLGYPALTLDTTGEPVHGQVLTSPNLGDQWAALDAFEGDEYERVVAWVTLQSGERVEAQLYVQRPST